MKCGVFLSILFVSVVSSQRKEGEYSLLRNVLEKCVVGDSDMAACFKLKAVKLLDTAYRTGSLPLFDAVTVEKDPSVQEVSSPLLEEPLENSLPRDSIQKNSALDKILLEKLWKYLNSRTLKVDLSADILEGRKKGLKLKKAVKKGGLYMMMFGAMGASLVQLALGKVALIAGKALLISKVALLIAAVLGLKSLLSHNQEEKHSPQVIYAEPEAHGGWSRNSLQQEVAHDLAFRGQRSFRARSLTTSRPRQPL